MIVPWYTTSDLISAVKRKISLPISQNTFSAQDIIDFLNEELTISQVPSVMLYHEEYFVTTLSVPMTPNRIRYPIPERAIGLKLRDVFWFDGQNIFEMVRIFPEDKAYFQGVSGSNLPYKRFYLEGNDVVLTPGSGVPATNGSMIFSYFLRPNLLVEETRSATINYFTKNIIVDNAIILPGDKLTIQGIDFEAVAGAPTGNQFEIGATSVITATNLKTAISNNGIVLADNGSPSVDTVTIKYIPLSLTLVSSDALSLIIDPDQGIEFASIPSNIVNGSVIDFLQTKPGHRTRAMDITIPAGGISASIISFNSSDVPTDLVVGDYICLAGECIIPQIPTDLHNVLAERTSARILASIYVLAADTAAQVASKTAAYIGAVSEDCQS